VKENFIQVIPPSNINHTEFVVESITVIPVISYKTKVKVKTPALA